MSADQISELPLDHEVEVEKGVFVQRRSFMAVCGAAMFSLLPRGKARAAVEEAADTNLSFDAFLAQANPLAQQLVSDISNSGQDRYLRSIAAIAAKLQAVPLPAKFNNTGQGLKPEDYKIGVNPGGDPFTVLHWRLKPGAICRPHVHEYGNVASIGIEGSVQVSNYVASDVFDFEETGTFKIRKTVDQLLTPGSANLLKIDMIHGFKAGPDGARGLDITTRLKPRPERSTPYLAIAEAASDNSSYYDATWDF